jgi:hypothetical protein
MKKIQIYNSIQRGKNNTVYSKYFLTMDLARNDQKSMHKPWEKECIDKIETYEGSNICNMAIENSPSDIYLVQKSCKYYNINGCTHGKYINTPEDSCTKITCPLVVDELDTLVVDGVKYEISEKFKTMCKNQGFNPSAVLMRQITDALSEIM